MGQGHLGLTLSPSTSRIVSLRWHRMGQRTCPFEEDLPSAIVFCSLLGSVFPSTHIRKAKRPPAFLKFFEPKFTAPPRTTTACQVTPTSRPGTFLALHHHEHPLSVHGLSHVSDACKFS